MKIKSEIKLIDYFKIIFLLLPALFSSLRSFKYFRIIDSNSWQTTDWLINYETGFLRRGLSGTLLNKLSSVFGPLDINMFCLFITLLCIWIISVLFILLSRSSNFLSRLTLCFSPFIYPLFFFWNPQAGGRKEIIGIFFIILVCCGKFLKRQNELKFLLSLGVFLLPSLILMHEALFFLCLPYIIISLIFWIINEKEIRIMDLRKYLIKNYLKFTSVILPSCIVFVVIYLYSFPSSERVSKMCLSLKEFYDDLICTNLPAAFDALAGITNWTAVFNSTYKSPIIYIQWFLCLIYLILFFSNVVAKIILSGSNFYKLNLIKSTSFVCLSISLFIFIVSFPLYAVALDYGRWIVFTFTGTSLFILFNAKNIIFISHFFIGNFENKFIKNSLFNKLLIPNNKILIFLLFLTSLIRIKNCCDGFLSNDPFLFGFFSKILNYFYFL